jgi:hypothetical protein
MRIAVKNIFGMTPGGAVAVCFKYTRNNDTQLHNESLDILPEDREPNSSSLEYYVVMSTI